MVKTIALVSVVSPMYDVPNFNLGLAELAGYLREKNPELHNKGRINFIEPDILFARSPKLKNSVEYTIKQLIKLKPSIIGFSAKLGSHDNLRALLNAAKNFDWNPVLVVGNVVSTFTHEILAFEYPDVIFCIGDGELAMSEIYQRTSITCMGKSCMNTNIMEIPNIAVVKRWHTGFLPEALYNKGYQLLKTQRQVLNTHKQYWLPAFDMAKTAIKHGANMSIRATTGCSMHCTFCSIPQTAVHSCGKKAGWRAYPVRRTIKQMEFMKTLGIETVYFVDDEFGSVDWKFLDSLGRSLCYHKNKIKINVSMRFDAFYSPDMTSDDKEWRLHTLRILKNGGLNSLFLGAESGCDSQLKRYGKQLTTDTILKSLEILLSEEIDVGLGWIPIDYLMTTKELEENMDFLEKEVCGKPIYSLVSAPFTTMRVQRGTPYAKMLQNKGLLGGLQDNESFHYATMQNDQIHEISAITKKWFEEVIDTRYAFRQFSRVNIKDSSNLLKKLHLLDIRLVRGLLENYKVFYKNGTKTSLGIEEQYAYLYTNSKLCCDLRKERDSIIDQMKVDLDNHYEKSRFVNFFKKILKIFQQRPIRY